MMLYNPNKSWFKILIVLNSIILIACTPLKDTSDFSIQLPQDRIHLSLADPYASSSSLTCLTGQNHARPITAAYSGHKKIRSTLEPGKQGVNISYRIYQQGRHVFEGQRFFLPKSFLQQSPDQAMVNIVIKCPEQSGDYHLVVDFVQEGVGWLHELQPQGAYLKYQLTSSHLPRGESALAVIPKAYERLKKVYPPAQAQLVGQAYGMAHEILRQSSFGFYHPELKKVYTVSYAGSQYPMVWTRDMAMIQRAGSKAELLHWSEMFFWQWHPERGVPDWVRDEKSQLSSDKNDVLSDQELWSIIAAFEAISTGRLPRDWLKTHAPGRTISWGQYLVEGLTGLLRQRFDRQQGCLWTGHIADWGDVGLRGQGAEDSTKMHGPRVCGLFSQALLYQALGHFLPWRQVLSPEFKQVGFDEFGSVMALRHRLRQYINASLWQEQKGFFKVHQHLDPIKHSFDEAEIFALGGHVVGLEADMFTASQRQAVLQVMQERQKAFAVSTISGNLLPPYPAGTFENPIMDEAWEYQNGGQWDWYGPRAALQLYLSDNQIGLQKFLEISRKVVANGSFYEWDHRDGQPGAGVHYRAAAAAFIWALNQGPLAKPRPWVSQLETQRVLP